MQEPINGQYKLDLDTGLVSIVAGEIGDSWVKEQQLIPSRFDHAAKVTGSACTAVAIQPHQVRERTRSGSDSNSVRNSWTAVIFSPRVAYTLPSISRRTSSNTRSAGLSSGL